MLLSKILIGIVVALTALLGLSHCNTRDLSSELATTKAEVTEAKAEIKTQNAKITKFKAASDVRKVKARQAAEHVLSEEFKPMTAEEFTEWVQVFTRK